jgi:hypothetical protein
MSIEEVFIDLLLDDVGIYERITLNSNALKSKSDNMWDKVINVINE